MNSQQNVFQNQCKYKGRAHLTDDLDRDCKHHWVFQNEVFLSTDVQRVFFLKWIW